MGVREKPEHGLFVIRLGEQYAQIDRCEKWGEQSTAKTYQTLARARYALGRLGCGEIREVG